MKKRRNYVMILAVIAAVLLIGILLNIRGIKDFYIAVLGHMTASEVIICAALVGFVFIGNKNYWLIVLGSAFVVSIFIQLVIVGNGFMGYIIFTRICAFVALVYAMNFVKIFVNK